MDGRASCAAIPEKALKHKLAVLTHIEINLSIGGRMCDNKAQAPADAL